MKDRADVLDLLQSEKGRAAKQSINPFVVHAATGGVVDYAAVIVEPAGVVTVSTAAVAVPTVEPGAVALVAATDIASTAAELEIAAATAMQIAQPSSPS